MKKIIIIFYVFGFMLDLTAQKQNNRDTFNQPDLEIHKAVKLRNTGMILTLSGASIAAAGYITTVIWSENNSLEGYEVFKTLVPAIVGIGVGIPVTIVGIPLWAIGGTRINKAVFAVKKFDIKPNDSLAVGIGITMRF